MRCPVCLAPDSKVTDSREVEDGFSIRRRRECQKCNYRFSTYENCEILNLVVIKRDGRKEAYSREKLESGLKKSLEKRPYALETFKKLINQIERDLQKKQKDELTSQEIGEVIMKRLKNFDKVAFIRFASVYRSFEDAQTFQREVQLLLGKKIIQNKKSKK